MATAKSRLTFVLFIGIALFSGCSPDLGKAKMLVGKSKSDVIREFGEPTIEEHYETTIMNPATHTQAEIDNRAKTTPEYGYKYGRVLFQFNVHDVVINVKQDK